MPFNFSGMNNIIYGGAGCKSILKNPIYTAIFISLIIILIVIISFHNSKEPIVRRTIRTFIYIFILSISVIFINNHILINDLCVSGKGEEILSLRDDNISNFDDIAGNSVVVFPELNE